MVSRLIGFVLLVLVAATPARANLVTWEMSGEFYSHWSHELAGEAFRGRYVFDLDRATAPSSNPRATFHRDALIYAELFFGKDRLISRLADEKLVRVNDTQQANPPFDGMLIAVEEGEHESNGGYGDFMFAWLSVQDITMDFLDTTALEPAILLGERWMENRDADFTVRFWDDSPQGFGTITGRLNDLTMTVPAPATVFLLGIGFIALSSTRRRG